MPSSRGDGVTSWRRRVGIPYFVLDSGCQAWVAECCQQSSQFARQSPRDDHLALPQGVHTWTAVQVQSGDGQSTSRDVYSPLYVDLDGFCDDGAVRFFVMHRITKSDNECDLK